jgi:hypothetical protein
MTNPEVDDTWWPELLAHIPAEQPWTADPVIVAEVGIQPGRRGTRLLCTGLVPIARLDRVLSHRERSAYEVSFVDGNASRPPRFVIDGDPDNTDGFEPLVVSWKSANKTVLWPHHALLAQYGLIPRVVDAVTPQMAWDDPALPRRDIVTGTTTTEYNFPAHPYAALKVARDVLQDYASIRESALVQFYYEQQDGPVTPDVQALLGSASCREFRLPGRFVDLRVHPDGANELRVYAQVWGVRLLCQPGAAPITAGRWDYGVLNWPGMEDGMTHDGAMALHFIDEVYVRDDVLGMYEGREEFSITPEMGAVRRGPEWAVSYCRRVGRDLIALELKKLYEGNYPEVVRHWHGFAVAPPEQTRTPNVPNIASRARRVTYGLVGLGEALSVVASTALAVSVNSGETVGLLRSDLDYEGWWRADNVEPTTRHAPIRMTQDQFLQRCISLNSLVGECFGESVVRRTLVRLGAGADDIKEFRSLKLLGRLVEVSELARVNGLGVGRDYAELERVRKELPRDRHSQTLEPLVALNELRLVAGHQNSPEKRAKLKAAFEVFGISPAAQAAGWGTALDLVYDRVGESLETATASIHGAD